MSRNPEPKADLAIELGTIEAANLLRISPPRLNQLTHAQVVQNARDEAGVPKRGKYVLAKLVSDYIEYLRSQKKDDGPLEQARARRAVAAATLFDMKVQRLSGGLIQVEPALEAVRTLVIRFRAKAGSLIPRIAKEVYSAPSQANALERAETLMGELFGELRQLKEEDLAPAELTLLDGPNGEEQT